MNEYSVFFPTDLREVAPGLSKGIPFDKKTVKRLLAPAPQRAAGGVIDLRELIAQEEIVFDEEDEDRGDDATKEAHEKDAAMGDDVVQVCNRIKTFMKLFIMLFFCNYHGLIKLI